MDCITNTAGPDFRQAQPVGSGETERSGRFIPKFPMFLDAYRGGFENASPVPVCGGTGPCTGRKRNFAAIKRSVC
jgi:hypothetical protein